VRGRRTSPTDAQNDQYRRRHDRNEQRYHRRPEQRLRHQQPQRLVVLRRRRRRLRLDRHRRSHDVAICRGAEHATRVAYRNTRPKLTVANAHTMTQLYARYCFKKKLRKATCHRIIRSAILAGWSVRQWLKWFCEAGGGSPDEARLEQTPYPFQPH